MQEKKNSDQIKLLRNVVDELELLIQRRTSAMAERRGWQGWMDDESIRQRVAAIWPGSGPVQVAAAFWRLFPCQLPPRKRGAWQYSRAEFLTIVSYLEQQQIDTGRTSERFGLQPLP